MGHAVDLAGSAGSRATNNDQKDREVADPRLRPLRGKQTPPLGTPRASVVDFILVASGLACLIER